MKNIVDQPCNQPNRKIIVLPQTGLNSFGHAISRKAILPMDEHYHQDCMELVFLVKGTQVYSIGEAEYPMSGFSVFVSHPNEIHGTGKHPQSVSEIYWMQLSLSQKELLGLSEFETQVLEKELLSLSERRFHYDREIAALLEKAFQSISSTNEIMQRYGMALLVTILYRIILRSRNVQTPLSPSIETAIGYIDKNIEQPLALEEIAEEIGLSLSRFKMKFKEEVGVTPREYINGQKIERAKKLLQEQHAVIEVAMRLSFSSSSYFSAIFKKFTTITPSEYLGKKKG